jgi:hypothetical protein
MVEPKRPNALPRSSPRNRLWTRDLWGDETAAEPLDDPRQYELQRRLREGAGRARDHEQRHADHEHRPQAVRVAEPPRRHQQQPQRERVARDDPLQRVLLRVQAPLDARQGDVHDRDVEQGHEPRGENDGERHPPVRVGAVFILGRGRQRS